MLKRCWKHRINGNMEDKAIKLKSIFEIESRIDLNEELTTIQNEFSKVEISTGLKDGVIINSLLSEVFKTWPFREGASNMETYMRRKGLSYRNHSDNYTDNEIAIYYFELLVNILYYAIEYESKMPKLPVLFSSNSSSTEVVLHQYLENIEYILEQNNLRIRKEDDSEGVRYFISKRNETVDSVIESNPEIADILLSYLDVRNSNDIDFKKMANRAIADYLEPKEKAFKGTMYKSLCDTLFFAYNKCNIRHNDGKQIKMTKKQQVTLYDNAFKIALHLLSVEDVKNRQKWIDDFREDKG